MAKVLEQGLLVAEIDETGAVAHVWIKTAAARFARPLKHGEIAKRAFELDRYVVSGATRAALARWLHARADNPEITGRSAC
jgi:hypothetical protein